MAGLRVIADDEDLGARGEALAAKEGVGDLRERATAGDDDVGGRRERRREPRIGGCAGGEPSGDEALVERLGTGWPARRGRRRGPPPSGWRVARSRCPRDRRRTSPRGRRPGRARRRPGRAWRSCGGRGRSERRRGGRCRRHARRRRRRRRGRAGRCPDRSGAPWRGPPGRRTWPGLASVRGRSWAPGAEDRADPGDAEEKRVTLRPRHQRSRIAQQKGITLLSGPASPSAVRPPACTSLGPINMVSTRTP